MSDTWDLWNNRKWSDRGQPINCSRRSCSLQEYHHTIFRMLPRSSSSLSSPDSVSSSLSSSIHHKPSRIPAPKEQTQAVQFVQGPQGSAFRWLLASQQWSEVHHPGSSVNPTGLAGFPALSSSRALNPLWGSYSEYNLGYGLIVGCAASKLSFELTSKGQEISSPVCTRE